MSSFPQLLLGCLFVLSNAADMAGGDKSSIMRSELKKAAVKMHAVASTAVIDDEGTDPTPAPSGNTWHHYFGDDLIPAVPQADMAHLCDVEFPVGPDACNCASASDQFINDEAVCIEAAVSAGVTTNNGVNGSFKLVTGDTDANNWEYIKTRPKGCFKFSCTEDPRGICYFFNPIGDTPPKCADDTDTRTMQGVPVCSSARYLKGTSSSACPSEYQGILVEEKCKKAGLCLGLTFNKQTFKKYPTSQSEYNAFPAGCYEKDEGGTPHVYFNPPNANYTAPASPTGTLLCNVTSITNFRNLPIIYPNAPEPPAPGDGPAKVEGTEVTNPDAGF